MKNYVLELEDVKPSELENVRQTVFMCLVDSSGSMENFEPAMILALEKFKDTLLKSSERDEIIVNIAPFTEVIDSETNVFTLLQNMPTHYHASGGTALYDSIDYGRRRLTNYIKSLKREGITAKGILLVFSDGLDESSYKCDFEEAKESVERLLDDGIIVAFVAFGNDANGIAENLGVRAENIWNIDATYNNLYECFVSMSKSVSTVSRRVSFDNSNDSGILFITLDD